MKLKVTIAVLAVSLALVAFPASASNLVVNPGFETGNLTGWTYSGSPNLSGVLCGEGGAVTTNCRADFWTVGSHGYLSQTISTTPGAYYDISLWYWSHGSLLEPESVHYGIGDFNISWDGNQIYHVSPTVNTLPQDASGPGWIQLSFYQQASGSSTVLQFGFLTPNVDYLDDVFVDLSERQPGNPVPEPATLMLLGSGLSGLLLRRKRSA